MIFFEDDVLRRRGGIETRMKDKFGAEAKPENQDHRQRVDVEERQDAEHALLAFLQRRRLGRGVMISDILRTGGGQIGVGQHRALRRAGRAAGVLDHRERVLGVAERMGLEAPVVVEEIAERDAALVVLDLGQHSGRRSYAP